MSRLAGRVAVVTGAAAGIGRAIATRFVAEGAAVVLADVVGDAVADAAGALGERATAVTADVAREADVEAMIAAAVERFGRLDVLVNNAGVGGPVPFDQLTPAEWDRIHDVDLRGVYLGCRHALPQLRRAGGGAIVNIASQSGLQGQANNQAYCAAKAGVVLLTRSLAVELAPEGIRVNCVCPGGTETALLRKYAAARPDPGGMLSHLAGRIPIGRLARPEEIAAAVLFLASDDASYVTGVALPVDGGATA